MSASSNRVRRAYLAAGGGGGGDVPTSAPERWAGSEMSERPGGRERYVAPYAEAAPARKRQNNQHVVVYVCVCVGGAYGRKGRHKSNH